MVEESDIGGMPPLASAVRSRRRFLRRAAIAGIGGTVALLVPPAVGAEDKKDGEERGGKRPTATWTATPSATAAATATPAATKPAQATATATATSSASATPTALPAPAAPRPKRDGDEDDSLDGNEVYGVAQAPRTVQAHRPPKSGRWKYVRIDHANRGVGQTVLTSPDADAVLVASNSVGAGLVGESQGTAAAGAAGVVGTAPHAPGVLGVSGDHEGVRGESETSIGVVGRSDSGWMGVQGYSTNVIGVQGISLHSIGVHGINGDLEPVPPGPPGPPPVPPQIGVVGESVHGIGVQGQSKHSYATQGVSQYGIGVRGISEHGAVAVEGVNNATPVDGGPALGVQGISSAGTGVKGASASGLGVQGYSASGAVGVQGIGEVGVGLDGISNGSAPGVQGHSRSGAGVWGVGASFGVHGESAAVGVDGFSASGVGVAARAPDGIGLQVVGRLQADAAGRGLIPAGAASAGAWNARCAPGSTVLVTLIGDPGAGVTVSHVVPSTSWLDVYLTGPTPAGVAFGYLVLD